MIEKRVRVPDMSCAHCKSAIESELNRLSGVERSNADVERGIVEVFYDEHRVSTEQIEGAVEEAGYTVVS